MNALEAKFQSIKRKIFLMIGRGILSAFDGSAKTAVIQITGLSGETITGLEVLSNYGFESYPIQGQVLAFYPNGNRDQGIVLAIHDRENRPKLNSGESQVYSIHGGYLKCNEDGDVEIQGAADFAVAYTDLKTAFDQLKTDLNTFISVYNLHTHATAPVGPISVPSATGTTSAADMSGAKVTTVRLP